VIAARFQNFGKLTVLRFPSFRNPLDVLFLVCCAVLTADVLVPEIWGSGKSKDYPLWYWAGQQVLQGKELYTVNAGGELRFLYPPFAAVLLAIPSYSGKLPLYIFLSVVNAVVWWVTGLLSNAMAGSAKMPSPWVAALPAFVTITFVFDMFDLGQPNLVLLAMMLFGFWLLQRGRPSWAGVLFALATAIKVFPVAVLPYLLWRRHWAAAASMLIFTGIFLVLVPAPVRGYQRNIDELATWVRSMVGSSSEQGFGQRAEQNWSWVNQSVIAMTHRLTRPVSYQQIKPSDPPRYVNLIDVDYKTANWIVLAVSFLIGAGFLAVMPPAPRVTRLSNAEELGILFCLMTIASPLARQYYFVWLFFPVTVLIHRAACDPRETARTISTWSLGIAGVLMALSLPIFPKFFQAIGNNLAATALIVGALAWHLRHPLPPDGKATTQPVTPGNNATIN
jgi:hypothetical protein